MSNYLLPFSVFASHIEITLYALKQLFRACSCKPTLVGHIHHLISSYEKMNLFSQHTVRQRVYSILFFPIFNELYEDNFQSTGYKILFTRYFYFFTSNNFQYTRDKILFTGDFYFFSSYNFQFTGYKILFT